jgi:hypothetical protein
MTILQQLGHLPSKLVITILQPCSVSNIPSYLWLTYHPVLLNVAIQNHVIYPPFIDGVPSHKPPFIDDFPLGSWKYGARMRCSAKELWKNTTMLYSKINNKHQ